MFTFEQASSDQDFAQVSEMYREYLDWLDEQVRVEHGIVFGKEVDAAHTKFMATIEQLLPPRGRLTLVRDEGGSLVGTGALKSLDEDTAYIKRMYVREPFRGKGLSRKILDGLLDAAREGGYGRVRLETGDFQRAAHGLYRSAGFVEIEPFAGTEAPDGTHDMFLFMELKL